MKKISILMMSVLFVFTSCSSDDDNLDQIDLSVDITGQWGLTKMEIEGDTSMTFEGQTVTIDFSGFGKDFDSQVLFTENPNEVNATGVYTMVLTTTFMGISDTEEYPVDFSSDFESGNWSIEGNQMFIVNSTTGEEQTAEIIYLSQNKMILVSEQTQSMSGMEVNIFGEMTLER